MFLSINTGYTKDCDQVECPKSGRIILDTTALPNGNKKSRSQTGSIPLVEKFTRPDEGESELLVGFKSNQVRGCAFFHRLYYREALVGGEIRGPLRRTEIQGSGYCNR